VWVAKIVAVTLALTGAGLLGIGATARVIQSSQASSNPVTSRVESAVPTIATTDADAEATIAPAPNPLAERHETEQAAIEPARSTPTGTPRSSSSTEVQHADPLAAELALLELLRQHERRFADGLLATERELLIIERLCQLGQLESARARDRRLFAAHRDAPQRARLLELCPKLGND
jgi:hypothetical protein